MDCARAVEALIARAADGAEPPDASDLAAHLASCARCRAEAAEIEGLWTDLAALRATPAPGHTDRIALRLAGAAPAQPRLAPALRAALWIGALLGAGLLGRLSAAPASPSPTAAVGAEWLLLLHEDPVPTPATPAVIAEYGDWASRLAAQGRLVLAEKLESDPGEWLPERPAASRVTGFFIVRAEDRAQAAAIASGGPHLSGGGTIEVRRIDPRGGRP